MSLPRGAMGWSLVCDYPMNILTFCSSIITYGMINPYQPNYYLYQSCAFVAIIVFYSFVFTPGYVLHYWL